MRRVGACALAGLLIACAEPRGAPPEPEVERPPRVEADAPEADAPDGPVADAPEADAPEADAPEADAFEAPPEQPAAAPDRARFESLWGEHLRIDEITAVEGEDEVVYHVTAIASRGSLTIGLNMSWPRLFPEERVVDLCARGSRREIDNRPGRLLVCEGDRLALHVPISSPPAEWTEFVARTPASLEDSGAPLRRVPEAEQPTPIQQLAPELGEARTRSNADAMRVSYWMSAREPGAVALSLPLHFPSTVLRVVARGEPITERVEIGTSGWVTPRSRELRVGDRVAVGYLRP